MSEKIRVLLLKPGEKEREMWIAPTHEVISGLVGGEFIMRNPLDDGTVVICRDTVDAEQEPSFVLRNSRGQVVTRFYGTVVVAGLFTKGAELDSLTDSEVGMALRNLEPTDGNGKEIA